MPIQAITDCPRWPRGAAVGDVGGAAGHGPAGAVRAVAQQLPEDARPQDLPRGKAGPALSASSRVRKMHSRLHCPVTAGLICFVVPSYAALSVPRPPVACLVWRHIWRHIILSTSSIFSRILHGWSLPAASLFATWPFSFLLSLPPFMNPSIRPPPSTFATARKAMRHKLGCWGTCDGDV